MTSARVPAIMSGEADFVRVRPFPASLELHRPQKGGIDRLLLRLVDCSAGKSRRRKSERAKRMPDATGIPIRDKFQ